MKYITKVSLIFLLFILSFKLSYSVKIDSLIKVSINTPLDTNKVYVYNKLAYAYYNVSEYDKSIALSDSMMILSDSLNFQFGIIKSLYLKTYVYNRKSEYKKSILYAKKTLKLATEQNNIGYIAKSLNFLTILSKNLGEYEQGLRYAEAAVEHWYALDDQKQLAYTFINIGLIYYQLDQYDNAIIYFEKTKPIFYSLNDNFGISLYLNNSAMIYNALDSTEEALKRYFKLVELNKGKKNELSIAYVNIGNVYVDIAKYDLAKEYYDKSLELQIQKKDKRGIATVYASIAYLYLSLENFKESNYYYSKSNKISVEINAVDILLENYEFLSLSYYDQGKYKKAYDYYDQYITLHDSLYLLEIEANIKYLEQQNLIEEQEASNAILKAQNLKSKIKNTELKFKVKRTWGIVASISIIVIVVLISLFFTAKSRRKIKKYYARLQEQHGEIVQQKKELEENKNKLTKLTESLSIESQHLQDVNTTKDKLFSIIGHDLKAPFNGIESLLSLLADESIDVSEEKKEELIRYVHNDVIQVLKLIDSLLLWSQTQSGSINFKPSQHNLYNAIESNFKLLKSTAKKKDIEVTIDVPRELDVVADPEMLSAILRNLLSNAIKFTNKGGSIIVSIEYITISLVNICVIDNGIGITKDILGKIMKIGENVSTIGTANEAGTGLGLLITSEFVNKHGASLKVKSEPNIGSEFCFQLPVYQK